MKISQITRHSSDFQQGVAAIEVEQALLQALPDSEIVQVTELAAGLFNNTYRIDTKTEQYILKVAPTDTAEVFYNERSLMQREQALSRQLTDAHPLIPKYHSFFTIGNRQAFLQSFVPGTLWSDVEKQLTEAENASLWQQLGEFAHTLHHISGNGFGYPPPFQGHSTWSDFIADNVDGLVRDCHRLDVFCSEIETYLNRLSDFTADLDEVATAKLLHGDLWPRNVIISGSGKDIRITAVIDGERAYWGDPISDWVLILYPLPASFWQGYGSNLYNESNPARIAVYKGMYFIVNILEATRFAESDEAAKKNLASINAQLDSLR